MRRILLFSACVSGKRLYLKHNKGKVLGNAILNLEGALATISLDGGVVPHEGNIMVNGEPVCNDGFTLVNAGVACRELGYLGALWYTKDNALASRYGLTSPDFAMDNVNCDGSEEKLLDCTHSTVYWTSWLRLDFMKKKKVILLHFRAITVGRRRQLGYCALLVICGWRWPWSQS